MSRRAALSAVGDKEGARTLAEIIFKRQERELGADHPYTLVVAVNLCSYLRGTGELRRALRLGEQWTPWSDCAEPLATSTPFSLGCAVNLANAFADLVGQHAEAERLERETLGRLVVVRGPKHPGHAHACQANLSITLAELGLADEAQRLRKKAR